MNFQTNHSLPTSLPLSSLLSLSVFLILFYLFFSLSFLLMHLSHAGTPAPCGSGRAWPLPFVSAVFFSHFFLRSVLFLFLLLLLSLSLCHHLFIPLPLIIQYPNSCFCIASVSLKVLILWRFFCFI